MILELYIEYNGSLKILISLLIVEVYIENENVGQNNCGLKYTLPLLYWSSITNTASPIILRRDLSNYIERT